MTPERLTQVIAAPDQASEEEKNEAIVALREALEPFSKEAHIYEPDEGDSDHRLWAFGDLKIGDLRRARSLLERQP